MTNLRFHIYLLLLAALSIALAYAAEQNEEDLRQLSSPIRLAIGLVITVPFWLSIFTYFRRLKALEHDEYQSHMLQRRMAYATAVAISYSTAMSFWDVYGQAEVGPVYIYAPLFWYGTFAVSGFFGPEKI